MKQPIDSPSAPIVRDTVRQRLQHGLVFIDKALPGPLTVEMVAREAGLSLHHFQRLFHACMGESVGRYMTARRLDHAGRVLAAIPETNILHLALEAGFETHSAFSRAFARYYGMSPSAFREYKDRDRLLVPPAARLAMPAVAAVEESFADIIDLPDLHFLHRTGKGMRDGSFFNTDDESPAPAFADLVTKASGKCVMTGSGFGVSPVGMQDDDAAILYGGFFADQLDIDWPGQWQVIAAGQWAVFDHIGDYRYLYQSWNGIYRKWLAQTGWMLRDELPFEAYISSPLDTAPDKLLTRIHIPVKKAFGEQQA